MEVKGREWKKELRFAGWWFESAKHWIIEDFGRKWCKRDGKPNREGWFPLRQMQAIKAQPEDMLSRIPFRWSLEESRLRQVKAIVEYVDGQETMANFVHIKRISRGH